VCEYCGSHLEVTQSELKVLGQGAAQKWEFPLALGDSFRHKGQRYEVTARLALIEDNDASELTRQYLLYSPRRGTMWLSEYRGHYDLSSTTHVMPEGNAVGKTRGDLLRTHDGREWVCEEAGEYELTYVDGALPWLATIGDRSAYVAFTAKDGSGGQFEVELRGTEIEYAFGRRMPLAAVLSALGRQDLAPPSAPLEDVALTRKRYHRLIAFAAGSLLVNGLLLLLCMGKGTEILSQSFSPDELTGEVLSKPFRVSAADSVVKIRSRASVNNAWMALNLAVVEGDDKVVHLVEQDIEYYHGSEGGESWSEGSRKKTNYFRVPEAGVHHLLVHAVSASGSATQADRCQHALRVTVTEGAVRPTFFILMSIVSLVCLFGLAARYHAWKQQGEED